MSTERKQVTKNMAIKKIQMNIGLNFWKLLNITFVLKRVSFSLPSENWTEDVVADSESVNRSKNITDITTI